MPVLALFIQHLFDPARQFYFVCVVVTVIVSITIHELAHGFAAIRLGDDTPILLKRITLNPLVHMGPFSLILLAVAGIAFGSMPVNPAKFRHRRGDAIVAFAGPASNLLLAALALLILGVWIRLAGNWDDPDVTLFHSNTHRFLWIFAVTNIVLFLFNLLPIPPLDGSRILADFVPSFRSAIASVNDPRMFDIALIAVLFIASSADFGLFDAAEFLSLHAVRAVSGHDLHLD